jgi:hypothetical protein
MPAAAAPRLDSDSVACKRSWSGIVVARPEPTHAVYTDLAATSASSVWAVGYRKIEHGFYRPVLGRWDGQRWRELTLETRGRLDSITRLTPDDAWVQATIRDKVTLLRWDGQNLHPITIPPSEGVRNSDMHFTAADGHVWFQAGEKIWARTGSSWSALPVTSKPVAGSGWIYAGASGHLWWLGWYHRIYRHTGTSWQRTTTPTTTDDPVYEHLTVTASGNTWVVGSLGDPWKLSEPIAYRWSGKTWTPLRLPEQLGSWEATRIAETAKGEIFVLLYHYDDDDGRRLTRLLHFDGRRWKIVSLPVRVFGDPLATLESAGDDLWIAGNRSILRYACS